ncbi:hypothetical protein ACHQM5_013326 [Ranunculus cassubicifolius]
MLATPSWTPYPKPQPFRTTVISSAKFQRRRNHRPSSNDYSYSEDSDESEYGSMGRIVLTSLKTIPSRKIEPVQKIKPKKEQATQATNLSGSDVLWALQRATKEKMRSRSKGKKKGAKRRIEGGDEGKIDYGDVKELNVKSDWGDRLDELECRLRELQRL